MNNSTRAFKKIQDKEPLIHAAVRCNDVFLLKKCLETNDYINIEHHGECPLYVACKNGFHQLVRQLVKKKSCNLTQKSTSKFDTPLQVAAKFGHNLVVDILLNNGVYPFKDIKAVKNAIVFNQVHVLKLFFDYIDTDFRLNGQYTLLTFAVVKEKYDIISLLLECECNPDVSDGCNRTALLLAVKKGAEKIVKLLVKKGANPNIQDCSDGTSAFHIASELSRTDIIDILLEEKGNINIQKYSGETALHIAVNTGNSTLLLYLLKNGALIDLKLNISGETALFLAIKHRNHSISSYFTKLLIQNGCDINALNSQNQTPLQVAVDFEKCTCVAYLLYSHCDLHLPYWPTSEMDLYIVCEGESSYIYNYFVYLMKTPKSLQQICRKSLRQQIGCNPWYIPSVNRLPIPPSMKLFLLYKELDSL